MKKIFFLIITLFNIISLPSFAGDNAELTNQINKLFIKYKIPGASIAVVQNGKIVWTDVLGYADLTNKRPITTATLFQACSITKTLTSVAVMKVLQQNDISLDAPVNAYLKRWQIPENKYTKKQPVTIRMLLNHTGAISNPYPDGGYAYNAKLPTLTQLFLGQPPATNPPLTVTTVPGSEYKYCNGCYSILQMFLEDVIQKDYPTLMQQLVLQPAGMKDSLFNNKLFLESPNKVALPYDANLQRFSKAPDTSPIYSTGLLWTNPTDLAKFIIQIQASINSTHGLVSKAIAEQLISPSSTPTRGLGFFISNKNGDESKAGKYFMHTGNNVGYLTILIGSIDGKNGAVIMINISPEWNAKDYPQFGFIKDSLKLIAKTYHWQ